MQEKIFNDLTEAEWEHKFADVYFDTFVKYELRVYGNRVMTENSIYTYAYNASVHCFEKWKRLDPSQVAVDYLKLLLKENNL